MNSTRSSFTSVAANTALLLRRVAIVSSIAVGSLCAQTAPPADTILPAQMQEKLQKLATDLAAAQGRLMQSQKEIQRLQDELSAIQAQFPASSQNPAPAIVAAAPPPVSSSQETAEKVDILQAEVKQHEQTKIESLSKYPVRLNALLLFNAFVDKGGVDNLDLPSVATPPTPGVSDLATGASVRQTILGIQATGPHLFGAQTSGDVSIDFYGGSPYANYGTNGGILRMRTAALNMRWDRDSAQLGLVAPLISPLSPTSYATVAEPSMAWAGNLWTWSPEFSYEHRFSKSTAPHVAWQFGLWDPSTAGYNGGAASRVAGPGERSGQPAYESRISFARNDKADGMQLGVGGYYGRQSYAGRAGDSWAVTADWRLPVGRVFELSGEGYRGRSLGGLGGGAYKDVVTGTDPVTGLATFRLLNDAGGWMQIKFHLNRMIEANGAFGLDNGFARDFHSLVLPVGGSGTAARARNHMAILNMVFSPKTYLILSPEFRRIWTWPITGSGSTANIFTMTFGLRF